MNAISKPTPANDEIALACARAASEPLRPLPAVTWPASFHQDSGGVLIRTVLGKETDSTTGQPERIPVTVAGPLTVEGVLSADDGRQCVLLAWRGALGQHVTASPAIADLANPRSSVIWNELVGRGLHVEPGRERDLANALRGVRHRTVRRSVDAPGWIGLDTSKPFYVTPAGQVFGQPDGTVSLTDSRARPGQFVAQGEADAWRELMATKVQGNSRIVFALAAALAAPALAITGEPSGIFSFTGLSGDGKSSCLRVAGSVWGTPAGMVRTWKGTMAGIEALLATSSDGPLMLDEMGQANAKDIGEIVYMIGNEAGSARMTKGLSAARLKTWRTVALSTGEETLEAVMRRAGQEFKGGMEVRCLVIPSDAGAGHRVYDTLNGEASDHALSILLTSKCGEHAGHAGPIFLSAFVEAVQSRREKLVTGWESLRARFIAKHAGTGAVGPVVRAATRFALAAWVGEFAIKAGALPFPTGHAEWAAATCFRAWLAQRGHEGDADVARSLRKLRLYLAQNGMSRFPLITANGSPEFEKPAIHAGWRRAQASGEGIEYLMHGAVWDDLFPGAEGRGLAQHLAERGLYRRDRAYVPGSGKQLRYRIVDGAILADGSGGDDGIERGG